MTVHKVNDGAYVISSHHVWMPGTFESERAAKYGFRFSDEELQDLQDEANLREGDAKHIITFKDLQRTRKERSEKQIKKKIKRFSIVVMGEKLNGSMPGGIEYYPVAVHNHPDDALEHAKRIGGFRRWVPLIGDPARDIIDEEKNDG